MSEDWTLTLPHIETPRKPMAPFRWFGGKGNLAAFVLKYIPKPGRFKIYVEPYAGAANILWRLPEPYPVEVLNDINEDIVNLFRVMQDPESFAILRHRLVFTPYARAEFARALAVLKDPEATSLDRAWGFFVATNQGFGGKARSIGDWGRVFVSTSDMAETTSRWRERLKLLQWWHDRLTRVQIDQVDGIKAIQYWDSPETLFYVDPPYVLSQRKGAKYEHEMTDEAHAELVETLLGIAGGAVVSGYESPIYRPLEEAGWMVVKKETAAHSAGKTRLSKLRGDGSAKALVPRTEVLWIHPRVVEALNQEQRLM